MKPKNIVKRLPLYTCIGVALVIMLYPIFWIFMTSIKPFDEIVANPPHALPQSPTLSNYSLLLDTNLPLNFWNSIFVAVFTILGIIILSALAAYPISKMRFRGRKVIKNIIMVGIMVPITVSLIPMFSIYNSIGLINSRWAVIFPQWGFAIPVSMFLCLAFLNDLPDSLIEAGYIDGAGSLRIFWSIVLPMMRNTIATIAIFQFVFVWNEFVLARTFLISADVRTVPLGLASFVTEVGRRDWGLTFAGVAATVLPTLIVFFILNKQVIKGMAAGAVKG